MFQLKTRTIPDYTTLSVLFFTKKIGRDTKALSIYARIIEDGKCSEMSLNRKTLVNEWEHSKVRLELLIL